MLDLILLETAAVSENQITNEAGIRNLDGVLISDVIRSRVSELGLIARNAEKTWATYEGISGCSQKVS